MSSYELVSAPLNRPNLFYCLDSATSIVSVFQPLSYLLSSVRCPEVMQKTLVFCRSKDTLYNCMFIWCKTVLDLQRALLGNIMPL